MSSPSQPSSSKGLTREEALAAAQARAEAAKSERRQKEAFQESDHEIRQKFRRLLDPGIMKHNDKRSSHAAFDTLLTLSDNLARDPENPKFQLFKTTNKRIKETLLEVTGALEYAVELGFRLEVRDLQPVYVFRATPRNLITLRVGAEVIREVTAARAEADARAQESAAMQKAAAQAAVQKAMQAFEDDRMTVKRRQEREARQREAAAERGASGPHPALLSTSTSSMPAPRAPPVHSHGADTDDHMDEGEDDDEEEEDEEEEGMPGHLPSRRQRRFPGGGTTLSGQPVEAAGPGSDHASQADDDTDEPPPYGLPGVGIRPTHYPGEGHRLSDSH